MKRLLTLALALLVTLGLAVPAAPAAQAAGNKLVAITYDDGPGAYTAQLLDGLKERGVKATFFTVGTNVARYPDIVARAYREGHQMANHTYSHPYLTWISSGEVWSQVQRVNDLLDRACGKGTDYMVRPPYGDINNSTAASVGAPLILWSVDPQDWRTQNAEAVRRDIVSAAHDGAIILVHDTHRTSVTGSLAAIDQLKAQGYEFVTVRELMRRRGVTPQNGALYSRIRSTGQDLGPIASPTISAEAADGGVWVTIEAEPGAQVYYSTDGSNLNQESQVYTGPFFASSPVYVRAVAAYNMNGSRSEETRGWCTSRGNVFADVPPSQWYFDPVDEAVQAGYFQGGLGGCFLPGDPITRGQLAAVLYRFSGETLEGVASVPFEDVSPTAYYWEAIAWAYSRGIAGGTGPTTFQPDEPVTRQELALMLWNFAGSPAPEHGSLSFTDADKASPWALDALCWAAEAGLLNGSGGTLNPTGEANRAQAAQVFVRLGEAIQPAAINAFLGW